ncbi:uncharacterized protein LOC129729464 [Wyeomyia smithii]|uniref:uncharacterized protein LOC129729464 n=1 Tax=Wyeomyia smithii TaxID=174621 RepID=UPI00246812C7|nr:uncharacterized protein LOC129729464 [Wyeomyia smithii]
MATVQSSKVAAQYNQHYTPTNSNHIPGVITIGPAAIQSDCQYQTITQIQPQERRPVPPKPIILNRSVGGPSMAESQLIPSFSEVDAQQPLPKVTQQSNLLLLVEWDMPPGEPNAYSVINASELVLHSQSTTRETIHTGKTIYVKRGKKLLQATVVIISDDKQFIETELRQLRKMAAENLYQNTASSSQNIKIEQATKRRRTETATNSPNEQEPLSPEYEPMPTPAQIATANWVNSCKSERVISPSPSLLTIHMSNAPAPPMTFHQQTQTDAKFFPQETGHPSQLEMARLLSLQESILAEQKSARMESEFNRKMMYDIIEQLNTFSETLKNIASKVESANKYEQTETIKDSINNVSNYVVLGTGDESRDRISVAESNVPKPAISNESSNNMVIDQLSLHDETNMSFGQTKYFIQEDTSSAASTPKNFSFSNRLSASALSLSNLSDQNGSNHNQSSKSTVNDMLKDWNEDESDESEMTSIGPNNTMVKKQVLRAINWTSYKAATRKLLMTLFTRDMLSTHTLTGRPSPAFMGDRAKPVKDKLDQKIIADIIAIVVKSCNVSESMVRTAITTKCADENKMSRMKNGKTSSQTIMTQFVKDHPATAIACANGNQLSTSVEMSTPAPSVVAQSRRIKRENKENVH